MKCYLASKSTKRHPPASIMPNSHARENHLTKVLFATWCNAKPTSFIQFTTSVKFSAPGKAAHRRFRQFYFVEVFTTNGKVNSSSQVIDDLHILNSTIPSSGNVIRMAFFVSNLSNRSPLWAAVLCYPLEIGPCTYKEFMCNSFLHHIRGPFRLINIPPHCRVAPRTRALPGPTWPNPNDIDACIADLMQNSAPTEKIYLSTVNEGFPPSAG